MVRVVLGFEVHSGGGGDGSHGGDNGGGGGGGNRDAVDGAGWDRQNFYNETNPRTDI